MANITDNWEFWIIAVRIALRLGEMIFRNALKYHIWYLL